MKALYSAAAMLATIALAGCTVHKAADAPPLSGPSGLAHSITVNAIPDTISQDGGSQSSIKITAIGPNGKAQAGVPVRIDTLVNGVGQDYGTLSARTVVTNSDGIATVVYTAPATPPSGQFGTCRSLPGTCVDIVATPTGTGFETAISTSVQIRLVPPGVILPPAQTPTAAFTISPTPVNFNISSTYDASTSCSGPLVGGVCPNASAITAYDWNFGDGAKASGRSVAHTFTSATQASTTFNITLTITNDRGLSSSTTQSVPVGPSPSPTGDFVFSPSSPLVNQLVVFNADSVRAAPGHVVVQYNWIFGDGSTANGSVVSHSFSAPGTYNVTLTVTDEVGQKTTIPHGVTVGATTGVPTATFTFSPSSPLAVGTTVTFDGTASTAPNGATIVSHQWSWGDGTAVVNTSTPTTTHAYAVAGTYNVTLTVIDSQGRSSSAAMRPIQVQ